VSGAGVYSENKIRTDIHAAIDGDGDSGVNAASAHISAQDSSVIDSIAGAASIAVGVGTSGVGVGVAIGLSLAFNEIDNDVSAFVLNADQGLSTTTGDVRIEAASQGHELFDLTPESVGSADDLTAAEIAAILDDVAQADRDNPNDPNSRPGDIFVDNVDDTDDDAVNEARKDIIDDQRILRALREQFADEDEALGISDTLAGDSLLTTDSGLVELAEVVSNDRILLGGGGLRPATRSSTTVVTAPASGSTTASTSSSG